MLEDLISKYGMTYKFNGKEIPEDILEYIIKPVKLCSSIYGKDMLLIGIISDEELIKGLVKCCRNQKWMENAPVIAAVCTRRMADEDLEVERYRLGKLKDELYDIDPNVVDILCSGEHTALCAANMMALAACEKGAGSRICAYFDVYKASKLLKVPNSHLVSYLLAIGYADEPETKRGNTAEDNVFYNTYGYDS